MWRRSIVMVEAGDRLRCRLHAWLRPSLADLLELSAAERIQLAQDLWDSVATEPEAVPFTHEQRAELDRRLVELERNPETETPWEEVRARLLGQR